MDNSSEFFPEETINPIWVAIDDEDKEGEWKDYYTGKVMNHTKAWASWAPNKGREENCATLAKSSSEPAFLDDEHCELKQIRCMCKRRPQSFLKLRGLCNDSSVDMYYKPMNNRTDIRKLKLIGLKTTIEHDKKSGLWKLSVVEFNVTGTSKTTQASFTLGRHNWTISGDKGCNKDTDTDSYKTELKMSGCEEDQFTCNDGQCISMDERCDQLPHCRDKSDERGCEILVLESGYNKNIPPITSDEEGKMIAVDVNTSIDIFKLVDIKEEDYSIEIQFRITMLWKENRATYQNLKLNDSLNALTQNDIDKLWLPKVIYENTDQKETTRLGVDWEWETNVEVKRRGNFTRSGLETVDETYVYRGDENDLIMSQTYTHEFQCQYIFVWYPFDTQVMIN